jgi:hypothetical protein
MESAVKAGPQPNTPGRASMAGQRISIQITQANCEVPSTYRPKPLTARATALMRTRRALGFKLESAGRLLPQFLDHFESGEAETIATVGWPEPRITAA